VVRVIQRIVNSDAYSRDDFYTEAALRRLFGNGPKIRISGQDAMRIAIVSGFGSASEYALPAGAGLADGIYIQMRKATFGSGPGAGKTHCSLQADFVGFFAEMDFDSVVDRLGPGWYRDENAEGARFRAYMPEPWNPPFPQPTGPKGNAIVALGEGAHRLRLEFSPAGRLAAIFKYDAEC
jgi:hypothetical protein